MEKEKEFVKQPPVDSNIDSGYAFVVLASVVLVDSLIRPVQKCLGVLFNEIKNELILPNSIVMLISGTMFGVSNFFGPFSVILCHRFGCRTMLLVGTMLIVVGLGTVYFIRNVVAIILIISILPGLGQSFMLFPNIHILSCYFKARFTTANGFRLSGSSIGSIIFPLILPIMVEEVGLYGSMLIMAGLILNVVPLSMFYRQKKSSSDNIMKDVNAINNFTENIETLSNKSEEKTINYNLFTKDNKKPKNNNIDLTKFVYFGFDYSVIDSSKELNNKVNTIFPHSESKSNLLEEGGNFTCCGIPTTKCNNSTSDYTLLNSFTFWVFATSVLLNNMQYNSFASILSPHAQNLGYNISSSALLITFLSITELISRTSTGFVIDKFNLHRRFCFMVSILFTCVIIFIIYFTREYYILALCCACFGLMSGITFTLIVPLLSEYFGLEKIATVVAFTTPLTGTGNVILPYIVGLMADIYDGFEEAILLLGSLSLLTLACECYLFFALKRKNERPTNNLTNPENI